MEKSKESGKKKVSNEDLEEVVGGVRKPKPNEKRSIRKPPKSKKRPCPKCGELKFPNIVCPNCGYYPMIDKIPEEE